MHNVNAPGRINLGGRLVQPHDYMPDALSFEDALAIASNYGGMAHGNDPQGVWDIEFPSPANAIAWAEVCDLAERATFRDPQTKLTGTAVIQVRES